MMTLVIAIVVVWIGAYVGVTDGTITTIGDMTTDIDTDMIASSTHITTDLAGTT